VDVLKNLTRDKGFYKSFFYLTLTVALQNVIVYGVNLADNIMLGSYSDNALAGSALANQIQFLLQMMVGGIGEGVMVLSSRFWGEKNMEKIRRTAAVGLAGAAVVTLTLFTLVFFFPELVIGFLTDNPEARAEGVRYIKVVSLSYPFFMITTTLLTLLRSVETVRIGLVTNIITLFTNITLNYLLIFGKAGLPELGGVGAALATLIARAIETAVVLVYLFCIDKKLSVRPKDLFRYDGAIFRLYLKIGSPVFLSGFFWGIAQSFQTAILGHMGKAAINANSVAAAVFSVISVFSYAAASASGVLIAKTIGEGKIDLVRPYTKTMQLLYLGFGAVSGTALFLIKDLIVGFYAIDGDSRALALQFMTVLSITLFGTSYQVSCLTGIVRGGGDTRFVFINDLIWMWLIVIPGAYLAAFVFNASPLWVFFILKCDQLTKCVVAVIKTNSFNWIKKFSDRS